MYRKKNRDQTKETMIRALSKRIIPLKIAPELEEALPAESLSETLLLRNMFSRTQRREGDGYLAPIICNLNELAVGFLSTESVEHPDEDKVIDELLEAISHIAHHTLCIRYQENNIHMINWIFTGNPVEDTDGNYMEIRFNQALQSYFPIAYTPQPWLWRSAYNQLILAGWLDDELPDLYPADDPESGSEEAEENRKKEQQ